VRVSVLVTAVLGATQLLSLPPVSVGGGMVALDDLMLVTVAGFAFLHFWRLLTLPSTLMTLAALELIAGTTSSSRPVTIDPATIGHIVALLAAYLLFVTFYRSDPDRTITVLARAWLGVGVLSAIVVLAQSAGVLPSFAFPSGVLVIRDRPTGLQGDANIAALSLVFALAPIGFTGLSARTKAAGFGLIGLAIVATLSRMGLLLFVGIAVIHWVRLGYRSRWLAALATATLAGLSLIFAIHTPETTVAAPIERFESLGQTLDVVKSGEILHSHGLQTDSAAERILLATGAWQVWRSHPWLGVGTPHLASEIGTVTGVHKASHNGVLDRMAIGGLFGLLSVAVWAREGLIAGRRWNRQRRLITTQTKQGAAPSHSRAGGPTTYEHAAYEHAGFVVMVFGLTLAAQFFLNVSLWPTTALALAARTTWTHSMSAANSPVTASANPRMAWA